MHLPEPARFRERRGVRPAPGRARREERPIDWKPQVCWQLPLRFDEWTDDNGEVTYLLREWKRHDWGEGGAEFAWWCTDDPLAFRGDRPVWRSLRDEIVELVGDEPYALLVDYLTARFDRGDGGTVFLPHPQVRRLPGGRSRTGESGA
ncbi:MAG: hypothetical protein R2695_21210 [Acidimicrobiales bacterium]